MKIAIPTINQQVDDHFGHCDHYTIFEINQENQIINSEKLPAGQGCGCKSNIASVLHLRGVEVMLAGNMGEGAKNVLEAAQIKVIRGCSGDVTELVNRYLAGTLNDSGKGCISHEHSCHQN
ncbi:MAG: NifB/NifX family molybdenum-iron cluster-binding protein [Bacteroidales bacterium]